jgi:hypothetical protein
MVKSDIELRHVIEGLYRTFSRYPQPIHVEGCPHCVSDWDHALLYSKDLRDLGRDEIARYSFNAMTTWGGPDDFRHFLPRIFELISADSGCWTLPEAVFGKLPYGRWETWPPDERQAITNFFEALWSNVLDHFPHAFSAEACLRSIAQAADDMARYLSRWRIAQSLSHAKHFAAFIEHNPHWSPRHGWSLDGAYWRERPVPARQVVDWLRDPARRTEMEHAFFHLAGDEEDSALLSKGADDLARLS